MRTLNLFKHPGEFRLFDELLPFNYFQWGTRHLVTEVYKLYNITEDKEAIDRLAQDIRRLRPIE